MGKRNERKAWLNADARFDVMDMIYFASVVGFASFLIAASIFVGLGTEPETLPVWVQTVFIAVGTLVALAKFDFDRFKKREEALGAELIAASKVSAAIQRVLTRIRHIRMWMEILEQLQSAEVPEEDAEEKVRRVKVKLKSLQEQIMGLRAGDVTEPAANEITENASHLSPMRAARILKSRRAIEDFRAAVLAVDESVSPQIAFYDLDVFAKMGQVEYQGRLGIGQVRAIEQSAPKWLVGG